MISRLPPIVLVPLTALLLAMLGSCGKGLGDGPGSMIVVVSGLPAGLAADIEVVGPDGFHERITGDVVLKGLAPGAYEVVSSEVSISTSAWVGVPQHQSFAIDPGQNLRIAITYEAAHVLPPVGPPGAPEPAGPEVQGVKYHVDCQLGNDDDLGTSESQAWRTLGRAERADLVPGDALLLRRGCSWEDTLRIRWSGDESLPVLVGAYGTGDAPRIHGVAGTLVTVSGSYVIVDSLHTEVPTSALPTDANCEYQPYGWHVGFSISSGTVHSTIRNSRANGGTAGIAIEPGARWHRIEGNYLHDNVVMSVNTPGGGEDSGAWGVLVNGDGTEIVGNRFSNNTAWCSYDFGIDGASVEVFTAKETNIHHNLSVGGTTFVELGGWGDDKAENTTLSYNLMYSNEPGAHFLIVVGDNHSAGPTPGTLVTNNTVYLTSADNTQGVVCYAGCKPELLQMYNNILWVNWRPFYTDGPLSESHNIFWSSSGRPRADYQGESVRHPSSVSADPLFQSAEDGDFSLREGSPAIDAGLEIGTSTYDLAGKEIPRGAGTDIGAYEY